MNRRAFIKVGAALIAVGTGCNFSEKRGKPIQYAITIDSNRTIGHLARRSMSGDIAEQIRRAILDLEIPHETSSVTNIITASFGVFTTLPEKDLLPETMIEFADKALYQAKGQGRNMVIIYNE